ncbi:ArsR/SmtB family transcription factor [Actinomadura logoneensis]|uniref:ArsR/SmtB family transcription factor n=1 Tax=Actinomadura logoneensis TaxID=2293572 RepID=UPI001F182034|nr:metalloregulator ArsR/SmtB family transcription factor [Actinomadura logoneensis]
MKERTRDTARDTARSPETLSPELLQEAAGRFGMLAATMRLHMVWVLAQGEQDVSSLAERVGGTVPAVSQHLAKLKLAGLVRSRREGRHQVYVVDDPHVAAIVAQMVAHLQGDPVEAAPVRGLGA